MLDADQKHMLTTLMAAKGAKRDGVYVEQQKAAHQEALEFQQGYAAGGSDTNLKATASQITPVVQSHLDMLNQMPAM